MEESYYRVLKAYYDIQVNIIIYEVIIKVCDLKLHIVFAMSLFYYHSLDASVFFNEREMVWI